MMVVTPTSPRGEGNNSWEINDMPSTLGIICNNARLYYTTVIIRHCIFLIIIIISHNPNLKLRSNA